MRWPSLAFLLLLFWPAPAGAQFRYVLSGDLRERFDSNVYAGIPGDQADWDMITELEPAFRFYYNLPTSLLWARYAFTFQAFAKTDDPQASRRLLGYANHLHLEYTRLFNLETGIRLFNRLEQGTENTQVGGGVTAGGAIENGFLTTGSKFLINTTRLELQHLWTRRWSSRAQLEGVVFRSFDRPANLPNLMAPPNSWYIAPSHRLDFLLENDLLNFDTNFTVLTEQRETFPELATYILDLLGGWRHHFNEFWDINLRAGINVRFRQIWAPDIRTMSRENEVGPLGGAGVRYRRGRDLSVALEYNHIYQINLEFESATASDTDEVQLAGQWFHDEWSVEAAAGFRYLRASPAQVGAPEASVKVAAASVSVAYTIRPGLSVEAGYSLEVVRDRPSIVESGQPIILRPDYERHLATVGLSFAWPPPPRQDLLLLRRASETEPIFGRGADGTAVPSRSDDVELPTERIRRERRSRELREEEPVQPERPARPAEQELFDTDGQR